MTDRENLLEINENFMLSAAEEDLLAGKIPQPQTPKKVASQEQQLPLPVQSQNLPAGSFWELKFWQAYFNVDTVDVRDRILATFLPHHDFIGTLAGNPDLYGPFWIPTTVIFALFATSTVAKSIASKLADSGSYTFDITLLSFAAASVYSYVLAMPALIYFVGRYHKAERVIFSKEKVYLFDLISVYGYGMTLWIPVSLFCIVPSEILRWIIVSAAFGWTCNLN